MTVLGGARRLPAEQLYGRLLATVVAHAFGEGPPPPRARVRSVDGTCAPLPLERWVAAADAVDTELLAGLRGPVLDIGCGPGRHVVALAAAGTDSLGVDLSPVAVRVARGRGGEAIPGSVFADVPRAGRWRAALLLDGNIGIGGDPSQLLGRTRELLAPGGTALVELDPPGAPTERTRVRLEAPGLVSEWFAWARVGADGIAPLARAAGFEAAPPRSAGGRWFARLRRP
jgi:SAM-dependent methyltransferase